MPTSTTDSMANKHARATKSGPGRELLKDQAYDILRNRILQNDYPPGSFLAERQLADELGMSKTPVKAALERLELEGYISVSPQQGIVVRELSLNEIRDFYEIRVALEGYVLSRLAGHLTRPQLEQWSDNLREQEANLAGDDIARAVLLDAQFHLLPAQWFGNDEIIRTMQKLSDKMRVVIHRVFSADPARSAASLKEHREIVQAVQSGAGRRAAELIEEHLMRGQQLLTAPRKSTVTGPKG